MPEPTTSPGRPLWRDTNGPTNEQGAGAPRRTSPGETAAAGAARVNGKANGAVARAERSELRWRDVQWVDFTSEPDSGMDRVAEPAALAPSLPEPAPMPEPAMVIVEPAEVAEVAPPLGNLLRRFALTAPASQAVQKSRPIPGLAPRFTRIRVPRRVPGATRLPLGKPGPIRLRAPTPAGPPARAAAVVVHPRAPNPAETASAPVRQPVAARAVPPVNPSPAREPPDRESPFPASISTPVSPGATQSGPELRGWRPAISAGVAATASTGRLVSAVAGAAARNGVARARAALPQRARSEPAASDETRERSATARRISGAVERVSRFVATHETRLRISGMAALLVVLVALGAYMGGALIAHVAEPGAAPPPATASAAPSNPIGRQLAMADKALHPGAPATTPADAAANEPPSDPAARAAFYIARAKAGDAAAQYDVGVLYAQGQGLVQDYASAATWFRAAAAQGNVAAEYNLGVLYAQGLGVAASQTEAINWYRSAAAQDHPAAEFNLALAYATGAGTPQDFAAAVRWYQKAAAQGLAPAMVNLAILYEAGNGVDRSPVDSYAWYSAAGERGDAAAKTRAGELFQQFNDRDKARAEGLAATIGAALDSFKSPAPPA